MIIARLTNISKTYSGEGRHEVKAIDAISLDIAEGDRLGIVGPNGAGKSTLLQVIAGLTEPTAGELLVQRRVTAIMTLGVGMRDLVSGRENIYLDGELQGKTRAEVDRIINEVIEFSELGDFIEQPVRTYSTGMKARLAFALLCHIEPELLIIDETLSVGDAAFSRKATAKIREICARGTSVILVSHSMTAVREICNRAIWLEAGRIVMDGRPHDVTDRYIDSVRRADNKDALARFSRLSGSRSMLAGAAIEAKLSQGGDPDRRVLEAGAPLEIVISATLPPTVPCNVVIAIVRLDGTRLFAQTFPAAEFADTSGRVDLTITMDPLVLGAAIYRLDSSVEAPAGRAADCSRVFEVYSPLPAAGGRPMLVYPLTVSVERIAEC